MLGVIVRRDLRAFVVVWVGQAASIVGSALTSFALGVWLFQRSGAVTDLAANALCATLPMAVLSPLAGALVDRHDRRFLMIVSDCEETCVTLAIAVPGPGWVVLRHGMCTLPRRSSRPRTPSKGRPTRRRCHYWCPRSSLAVPAA